MAKKKISSNRSFGILFFFVFFLISIYPLTYNKNIYIWLLILSIIFLVLGVLNSKLLSPLNRIWINFGNMLGKFMSPIIMGIIFFVVVTPTGIIMKLLKKDLLNLKYNNEKTYWIEKTGPRSKMKNQF